MRRIALKAVTLMKTKTIRRIIHTNVVYVSPPLQSVFVRTKACRDVDKACGEIRLLSNIPKCGFSSKTFEYEGLFPKKTEIYMI